ncbi:PREDICTED: uncharacterized protein LOC109191558 [Ipomoea nil]|uniref:uncharacterized protein LOC109191558 n=1 Tax=Ipomoea nil TaxID=35883 RepID=UPI0009010C6C|nr:PREDICTED: uncharacterized protein LOC109191558 [Ipomoea nil]
MDRSWMYKKRNTLEYVHGVQEFVKIAEEYASKIGENYIVCPCYDCRNLKKFRSSEQIKEHLIRRGFKIGYDRWIWHGETVLTSNSTNQRECRKNVVKDQSNEDNVGNDGDNDRLDELIRDMQGDLNEMPQEFESFFESSGKPLFSGCSKFTKLSAVLKLYTIKAKHRWSDKSFTELLEFLKDMLPNENELPCSTYEAKKMLCPLRLDDACEQKKSPPAKLLWYLPVIPRFKRLFANAKDAKNLQWHASGRKEDGKLRHPADSPQWKNINKKFSDFGAENRNLRLGLCTDGMNPHGNMSSRHSTWPVLLTIYNLPPWLCMKRKYIILSLLISGPKQPGNDIDVYLAPLIEDLKKLWNEGVTVFDAHSQTNFTLRAMLFCTINDFPAYGNLSGYTTKGAKACPVCEDETFDLWLNNSRKNVFMSHRTFLPIDHPYRKRKKAFNGKSETGVARLPLSGDVVYDRVKNIGNVWGKTSKTSQKGIWKKRSILWDLPYWEHLSVRHCLDVMHVEKNICDCIIETLLNIQGKTKDGIKARKDMVELGIRTQLATQESGKMAYLPPACYTLSKKEKTSFCSCLNGVKVPSGYSSNIKKLVSMKDLKLVGMKSHDCHVLMQHMLPIAIRGILPNHVRQAITKLCYFFNVISSKVVDPEVLDSLQADVVVTLCQFEMYFPPSFFDVMVHLTVHLVWEIKICGPVFLRYMYPYERYMGILKGYVRNRYRPEGSIIEAYGAEEVIDFCTDYLANVQSIGVSKSRHEGRLTGKGTIGFKTRVPSQIIRNQAHHLVLQQLSEVHPYLEQHLSIIRQQNPSKGEMWVTKEHNSTFITWFKDTVMQELSQVPNNITETIRWLSYGPRFVVSTYEGYDINGRGVRVDDLGFTLVDFGRLGYHVEPFILASQAKQVFYVSDPIDSKWSIVLQGKRSIVGVGDVVDEEEYDQFDETPPFSIGIQHVTLCEDNIDTNYMRTDHEEGLWIDHPTVYIYMADDHTDPVVEESSKGTESKVRKARRATTCSKMTKKRLEDESKVIEFDEKNRPLGPNARKYSNYLGLMVRIHIDINIPHWRLVPTAVKDAVWDELKA